MFYKFYERGSPNLELRKRKAVLRKANRHRQFMVVLNCCTNRELCIVQYLHRFIWLSVFSNSYVLSCKFNSNNNFFSSFARNKSELNIVWNSHWNLHNKLNIITWILKDLSDRRPLKRDSSICLIIHFKYVSYRSMTKIRLIYAFVISHLAWERNMNRRGKMVFPLLLFGINKREINQLV